MTGIQYLTDDHGKTTAVQIDIHKRPEIWADIQDAMLSKERLKGSFEPIGDLHARLMNKAKPSKTIRARTRNVSR